MKFVEVDERLCSIYARLKAICFSFCLIYPNIPYRLSTFRESRFFLALHLIRICNGPENFLCNKRYNVKPTIWKKVYRPVHNAASFAYPYILQLCKKKKKKSRSHLYTDKMITILVFLLMKIFYFLQLRI